MKRLRGCYSNFLAVMINSWRSRRQFGIFSAVSLAVWLIIHFSQKINLETFRSETLHSQIVLKPGDYIKLNCSRKINIRISYEYPVTLVTCYFPFKKAKHSKRSYIEWIQNFLGSIKTTPFVIFTTANMMELMLQMRSNKSGPAIFIICESIWATPWIKRAVPKIDPNITSLTSWEEIFKLQQPLMDPERLIHSPEIYAVWSHKTWMLDTVAEVNPFKSDYFLWVDMGCFRSHHSYRAWPSPDKIKCIFHGAHEKFLFGLVSPLPNHTKFLVKGDIIQGTFFGGTQLSVANLHQHYENLLDSYFTKGQFVGKDQSIFNSLALQYLNKVIGLQAYEIERPCGDPWFYFQHLLAYNNETLFNCSTTPILGLNSNQSGLIPLKICS